MHPPALKDSTQFARNALRVHLVGENVTDASALDFAWLGFWYGPSAAFPQFLALCRAGRLPVETSPHNADG